MIYKHGLTHANERVCSCGANAVNCTGHSRDQSRSQTLKRDSPVLANECLLPRQHSPPQTTPASPSPCGCGGIRAIDYHVLASFRKLD